METTSNDLINFLILPTEIQQHIAAYLDAPALGFFAQSNKQILKNILPLLRKFKASFPLWLTAKGHSTHIYQANQLFVCGANYHGQLGVCDEVDRTTFTAVMWPEERGQIQQVIAGEHHTVVLTQANQLWMCGANESGQLGLGDKAHRASFMVVPWPDERGRIQQVIAGGNHTVVVTHDNRLWVCGDNQYGQLGLGDKDDRTSFTAVPWPTERGQIQQVIAGGHHTGVLTEDNRLWLCGNNEFGQLGLGDKMDRASFNVVPWPAERSQIHQVVAGNCHTVVLTQANRLWVCGCNFFGQLGLGSGADCVTFTAVPWIEELGKIEQLIAGGDHTIMLTQANRLWMCGNNSYGQLGLDDKAPRYISTFISIFTTFTEVPWSENQGTIQQVIAGFNHTVVLTQANRLWMCGNNAYGQLGLGSEENHSTFIPVKVLPEAMQQILTLNNYLNQLIKFGAALTPTPDLASGTLHSKQRQPDEPDGQPLLKKMRL